MKNRLCLCLLCILGVSAALAQSRPTRAQYAADADSLYAGIKEIHPNMFAFIPQDRWEKKFIAARNSFTDSTTIACFFRTMAPLVSELGDGHTNLFFPDEELAKNRTPVFPYAVRIDKKTKELYVGNAYNADKQIPAGARVISISGHPATAVVDTLIRFVSGEKEYFKLEMLGYFFPNLFTMVCRDPVFAVRFAWNNTATTAHVPACTIAEIGNGTAEQAQGRGYALVIPDHPASTALLTLNRCDVALEPYNKFLDSCFTCLRQENIDHLVIDIRSNGGGDSRVADELFEYISPGPFTQCDKFISKISGKLKRNFLWMKDEPIGIKEIALTPNPLKNYPNRFRGKVYLLTSNYTFSAAADLAWAFKHYRMGTVIGEQTGGLGYCFGDSTTLTLPNTKISCGVSWKLFYNVGADETSTHGTYPDFDSTAPEAMTLALKMIAETN